MKEQMDKKGREMLEAMLNESVPSPGHQVAIIIGGWRSGKSAGGWQGEGSLRSITLIF